VDNLECAKDSSRTMGLNRIEYSVTSGNGLHPAFLFCITGFDSVEEEFL